MRPRPRPSGPRPYPAARMNFSAVIDASCSTVQPYTHLPFLTGTPRFLSSALSRAEPSLTPCALSHALSLASVHFFAPLPLGGVARFTLVPAIRLLRRRR